MRRIFVTGIGTDVGKTIVSAILTEALEADYWKPIQAGDLDNSDTMKVKGLVSNIKSKFHPEALRLNHPMSPHAAARLDGLKIDLNNVIVPETSNRLIIEGAGGLLVPLSESDLIIDLIQSLSVDVVLVSRNYLGSINHTLLSIEALKARNIPILGIVFNGTENKATEGVILSFTGLKCLGRIPELDEVSSREIKKQVAKIEIDAFKKLG